MMLKRIFRIGRLSGRLSRKPEPSGRSIVLFGDSHSYAVQRAIEKRRGKGRSAPLVAHRLLKMKNGTQLGDTTFEDLLDKVSALDSDDVVLSMIGGNQYAVFSMIQHPRPYDFFCARDSKVAEETELIPYRVLAQVFADGIRNGDGRSLKALRKATRARVVHVIPPPPKSDNVFIQEHHGSVFANEGIATHGVSSPALRMKFWALQKKILEDLCAELGVEVMMPPSRALDEAGFLARDFYAKDATHANHVYGELLIREVESRFASAPVQCKL